MATTTRFRLGFNAAQYLFQERWDLIDRLGLKGGYWHGLNDGWAFTLKLPEDIEPAWQLMSALAWDLDADTALPRMFRPGLLRNALFTLHSKLAVTILGVPTETIFGVPTRPLTGLYPPLNDQEKAFREAIRDAPGDLASWSAYADWMQEQGGELADEGLHIARWLAPKPITKKKR